MLFMKNALFLILATLIVTLKLTSCASNPQEKFKMATLYYQKSAEVKALYYQGFNAAIDQLKNTKKGKGNQCVVMDVDETILDNSPYQGWLYENKKSYTSDTWDQWVRFGQAKALPGAVDFINQAKKLKFDVVLITNRKSYLEEVTFKNLKEVGISVPRKNLIGRDKTSSKVERREEIEKNCAITLLAGDSAGDFHGDFESDYQTRLDAVEKHKSKWGRKYIILPNPMYGDWTRKGGAQSFESAPMSK